MTTASKPQADLRALIAGQQDRFQISADEIAAALGVTRATWYNYKNDLDKLSIGQLRILRKFLKISEDDLFATIKI